MIVLLSRVHLISTGGAEIGRVAAGKLVELMVKVLCKKLDELLLLLLLLVVSLLHVAQFHLLLRLLLLLVRF